MTRQSLYHGLDDYTAAVDQENSATISRSSLYERETYSAGHQPLDNRVSFRVDRGETDAGMIVGLSIIVLWWKRVGIGSCGIRSRLNCMRSSSRFPHMTSAATSVVNLLRHFLYYRRLLAATASRMDGQHQLHHATADPVLFAAGVKRRTRARC